MNTFVWGAAIALTIFGGVVLTTNEASASPDDSVSVTTTRTVHRSGERDEGRAFRRHRHEVRFDRGHHYGWERGRSNPHRRVIRERVIRESDD